jgi:hypothetical protein
MKKFFFSLISVAIGLSLFAINPVERGVAIDGFIKMLDGTEAKATEAVKTFCSEEVIADGMIPFGKNAKIISEDGDCVIIALKADGEENQYELCEEDGKIVSFGWYYDDDDDDEE